jgi:hypothetical protein
MNPLTTKLIFAGALFLFTLISGVIVSHSGRPLNIWLVSVHKFIAIGTLVLVGVVINQLYKTAEGKVIVEISLIIISGILSLALIATGALLTREEMQLPEIVLTIHKMTPLLALVSSTLTVYLLVRGNS